MTAINGKTPRACRFSTLNYIRLVGRDWRGRMCPTSVGVTSHGEAGVGESLGLETVLI